MIDGFVDVFHFLRLFMFRKGGIDSIFTDLRQPPQTNVWGEAKRFFPNSASAIALRGDINADTCDTVNLNLRVNGLRNPTALQFVGAASKYTQEPNAGEIYFYYQCSLCFSPIGQNIIWVSCFPHDNLWYDTRRTLEF